MVRLLSGQSSSPTTASTEAKAKRAAREDTPAIPPELLLRRDHNIRYQRDGAVFATDGKVGTLRKVVVDETVGEVAELVVEIDGSARTILLNPDLVDKSAGSAIFLTINRIQFEQRAASAPAYEKKQFAKADIKSLIKKDGKASNASAKRSVANATSDYVETPTSSPLERLNRRSEVVAAD